MASTPQVGKSRVFQDLYELMTKEAKIQSEEAQEVRFLVWERKKKKWTDEAIRYALLLNNFTLKYIDRALEEWYNDNRAKKWTIKGRSPEHFIGKRKNEHNTKNHHRNR